MTNAIDFERETINIISNNIYNGCKCKYCLNHYKGELIRSDGRYYSASDRKKFYSPYEKEHKHLCPGHYHGYRFIINEYTKEGDLVADPCAGTGTALCEAVLLGRDAIGSEIQFVDIIKSNVEHFKNKTGKTIALFEGDGRDAYPLLEKLTQPIKLIVSGPPYFRKHDAPERKNINSNKDSTFDYNRDNTNLANIKNETEYYDEFFKLYSLWSERLEIGGHICFIVKDYMENKKIYRLHEKFVDKFIDTGNYECEAVYSHKHYPPTLYISTYNKIYKDAETVPKDQIMVVLKKIK